MLQIDGYDICGENVDGEVQDFIKRFIPTESFMPWLIQGYWPGWNLGSITCSNGYAWGNRFKLNRLLWPSDARRWSYGHYLVNSDTVSQIGLDAFPQNQPYMPVSFSVGNPESNSSNGSGTINAGETLSTTMYVLPPYPLSGLRGLTGMIQSLYLITVTDARYWWWYQNLGGISISSSTTWASLITTIATILNVTITPDTINAAYLGPSQQSFSLPFEPVPIVLDAIAYNTGQRFVANYDGTFSMQLYRTALSAFNNDMDNNPNRLIVSGGQRFANPL